MARRRLKIVLLCGRHYINADYYQCTAVELFLQSVNLSFHRFSGLATLLQLQYLLHMIAPSPCMSAGDITNHHVADISGRSFKFQPPCPQIWPWGSLTCFYWKCKQMLLLSRRERSASICYRYRGNLLSGCSWMVSGSTRNISVPNACPLRFLLRLEPNVRPCLNWFLIRHSIFRWFP